MAVLLVPWVLPGITSMCAERAHSVIFPRILVGEGISTSVLHRLSAPWLQPWHLTVRSAHQTSSCSVELTIALADALITRLSCTHPEKEQHGCRPRTDQTVRVSPALHMG